MKIRFLYEDKSFKKFVHNILKIENIKHKIKGNYLYFDDSKHIITTYKKLIGTYTKILPLIVLFDVQERGSNITMTGRVNNMNTDIINIGCIVNYYNNTTFVSTTINNITDIQNGNFEYTLSTSIQGDDVYSVNLFVTNIFGTTYSNPIMKQHELCLAQGTLICTTNGYKKIEDITYDDELLCWDFDDCCMNVSTPLWIMKEKTTNAYNLLKFSDGTELKTIKQHRIFNKEKGMFTYPMTDETPINTTSIKYVSNNKIEEVSLISKNIITEEVKYYNVITKYHINLFSNNILTSCRYNNIYPISEMKFVHNNNEEMNYKFNDYIDNNISYDYIYGLRLSEQSFDKKENIKYINNLKINKKL